MYTVLAVVSAMPVCLHFSGHFVMFSSFIVHEQALNCIQKEWFTDDCLILLPFLEYICF